jgi:methionyl-tRNA synthetase
MKKKVTQTQITGKVQNMNEETKSAEPEKVFATIDDFQKIEIRVGTVLSVDVVEGADKLYILKVDLGEENPRQILSGIREYVTADDLLGKQFPFVTNLAPRMLRGHESQGMILAGSADETLALLNPSKPLPNGTRLR